MLASALTALNGSGSVSGAAISADLDEKSPLLCNGFFDRISNWQASDTPATLRFIPRI
jgi:hypothetical protein